MFILKSNYMHEQSLNSKASICKRKYWCIKLPSWDHCTMDSDWKNEPM